MNQIRRKWDEADACEAKADGLKWEVAGLLATSPKTVDQLAQETARNRRTVQKWRQVHREYEGVPAGSRPSFNQAMEQAQGRTPEGERQRKDTVAAKKVARERPEDLVAELPGPVVEKLARAATDTLVERSRAKRKEHDTTPTVRDLMGDERFDPAEFWADTLVIRVNRNARELASLIKRGGGLLFGTMPPEEAFEYLHEAERLIAEARAAAQEQARDQVEV